MVHSGTLVSKSGDLGSVPGLAVHCRTPARSLPLSVLLFLSWLMAEAFLHWDAGVEGAKGAGAWALSQHLLQSRRRYFGDRNAAACVLADFSCF